MIFPKNKGPILNTKKVILFIKDFIQIFWADLYQYEEQN